MNAIVFERVKEYYSGIPSVNVHVLSEKDFVDCVYPNPDTLSYEPCYERHYFIDGEDCGVNEEVQTRFANWREMTVALTSENIDKHIANFEEMVEHHRTRLEKDNFHYHMPLFSERPEYSREEMEFFTMVVNTLREIKERLV